MHTCSSFLPPNQTLGVLQLNIVTTAKKFGTKIKSGFITNTDVILTYFYHTATLAIGYHADIHSIASVDDKHDFIAKEAHNMFSNAGTNIDLEQAKYFIN